jgi:hypothetical protein
MANNTYLYVFNEVVLVLYGCMTMQNVMDASIWICSDAALIEKNDSNRR